MMRLKSIIITIIIFLVLILFISTIIFLSYKNGFFNKEEEISPEINQEKQLVNFTFLVEDQQGKGLGGTFWIRPHNLTEIYQSHHFSSGYNTIKVEGGRIHNLQVKSEGYYLLGGFTTPPLSFPYVRIPRKIENNLEISSFYKLRKNIREYPISLTAKDDFKQTHVCIKWTVGILEVKPPEIWFDLEVLEANPPKRFENSNFDKCYYLGGVYNMTKKISFTASFLDYFNEDDQIEFMFYDREKSYDSVERDFVYRVEDENYQDVGSRDFNFTLTT